MSAAMINVGLMRESRFPIRNATAHPYACVTDVAKGTLLAGCDTRQLAARIWAHGVARLSDVIPLNHVPRRLADPVRRPRAPRHAAGAHRRIQLGVPIRCFANRSRSSFRPRRFRPRSLIEPAQQAAVQKNNLLLICWEGARHRPRSGVPSGSSVASGELRWRAGPSSLRSAEV